MQIEPFLIASSLEAVVAQRLLRQSCQDCLEQINLPVQLEAEVLSPESPNRAMQSVLDDGTPRNKTAPLNDIALVAAGGRVIHEVPAGSIVSGVALLFPAEVTPVRKANALSPPDNAGL